MSWRLEETCCYSDSSERPSANTGGKNSPGILIIIIIVSANKKEKRTCHLIDFAVPVHHGVKLIESEKIDKYLDLARELEKAVEYEGDSDTNCS